MTAALDACRHILARSGSSFATAFRILPAAQRDALTAFYAFCRVVDDEVDGARRPDDARRQLDRWRERLARLSAPREAHPVVEALAWAARRFDLRVEHLQLVLDGVAQDIEPHGFATFAELYAYCYRVASSVGLVCVGVLAGRDAARAETYAELTGVAVQLTNVLRDAGEDARRGRIYLPLEDLQACGVRGPELSARRASPAVERLLRFEARRAAEYYDLAAAALPPDLAPRLFFAEALRETYRRLLGRIEEEGFPVLERRVALGSAEKLRVALRRRFDPRTFLAGATA
ncbi:MAG: squalene/phytoene synthase family protein [Deltaproteobacteria bacterium]|nr:squalene/phytoene synthase family protein [Deltaproteobacteria bacterium]